MIAIVGSLDSSLATAGGGRSRRSFAEREAGPHGLVPTASVAVALAIGDALALTVMETKGITREAFAANHPSGRLGRRLTLRVRDVMHAGGEQPEIGPQTPLMEVVGSDHGGRPGRGATSSTAKRRLLGIVTDGDLRRTLQRSSPASSATSARRRS